MRRFLLALSLLLCTVLPALAQTAITLPIVANAVADLGNGPIKVRMIAGNASIFTAQGSGTGGTSGASTTLTLTATPATPPLVGGLISGAGITSGTTVVAYNGTTGITLSAAMTVPGGTTVSWGAACPSSVGSAPVIQASPMADYYIMYTQARVCAVSPGGPVNTLLINPIFYDQTAIALVAQGLPKDLSWYNAAGTGLADSGIPVAPVGGLPLYASPSGMGNCLSPGAGSCALATACSFASQIATFLGQAGPVNFANGTYSFTVVGGVATPPGCNVQGEAGGSSSQLLSLLGNCSSPSSVILSLSGLATAITGQDHATIGVNCMQFQSSGTGGTGIFCRQQAICDYSNVIWGPWGTGGAHVSVDESSVNVLAASGGCETISANFNIHWNLSNAHLSPGCATNIPSAVSWSANGNGFLQAVDSYVDLTGWSTTGSGVAGSTGQPANLSGPGYLLTAAAAACASVLPGNTACNFSLGFQDNAGEGMTGTGILVGQTKPTITDPIIAAHTYAGLPASPTAGRISHIVDGLAANCGDGFCTTPGATVTGGSGGIDLMVGYDGAAWRIFRAAAQFSGPINNQTTVIPNAGGANHAYAAFFNPCVNATTYPCTGGSALPSNGVIFNMNRGKFGEASLTSSDFLISGLPSTPSWLDTKIGGAVVGTSQLASGSVLGASGITGYARTSDYYNYAGAASLGSAGGTFVAYNDDTTGTSPVALATLMLGIQKAGCVTAPTSTNGCTTLGTQIDTGAATQQDIQAYPVSPNNLYGGYNGETVGALITSGAYSFATANPSAAVFIAYGTIGPKFRKGIVVGPSALDTGVGAGSGGLFADLPRGASLRWQNATPGTDTEIWGDANGFNVNSNIKIVGKVTASTGIVVPQYLISGLPTCNSGEDGTLAEVTNGVASPTYNASVSTTGTTHDLVFCNGAGWTYH
jgi:hypothetical protein